jgi:hypothetical protein
MKHLRKSALAVLGFSALVCVAVAAAADTNFSGTWKLNVAKSDYNQAQGRSDLGGRANGLSAMTLKIEHKNAKLKVRTDLVDNLGAHTEDAVFTTDGKPQTNSPHGFSVETSAVWDEATLVMDVKEGLNFTYKERWSLSPDGKTLAIKHHIIYPQSDVTEEFVFDKQ